MEHLLSLLIVRLTKKVLLAVQVSHALQKDFKSLLGLDQEIHINQRCIIHVICSLHLLLYHHVFNLDQVEKGLNRLLGFLAFLSLLISSTVGNDPNELINHHLVLDCLIVVVNLKEIVGYLLIDVDFLFQISDHFQDLGLVINSFFIAL